MARRSAGQPAGRASTSGSVRCAIYTRKSTEEGLEQAFNSLDAQREACAAYVMSQIHEGWTLLPDYYDDGGFSGGNMDRPGLEQLLAEVAAGRVDVIVVYKVDRLTRSLSDFARIVEVLDDADASFVSVTQAFNTTTSMGRLTLNVLLSFAQFEREVTGERIRDKIAASKKKGMWMGGNVPLGYAVADRKLVVVEEDAATVRMMFERYLALGSVLALKAELDASGVRSRTRTSRTGRCYGGTLFSAGALYCILQNRVYLGEVRHHDNAYAGEHDAIIDPTLFDDVQQRLERNRAARLHGENADEPSLLAGIGRDQWSRLLSPSHAVKRSKRYRYYVSRRVESADRNPLCRIPAADLEDIVLGRLRRYLLSQEDVRHDLPLDVGSHALADALDSAMSHAAALDALEPSVRRAALLALVQRIDVLPEQVSIALKRSSLGDSHHAAEPLLASAALIRTGSQMRMTISGDDVTHPARRDAPLIKLLTKAHQARAKLAVTDFETLQEAAADQGLTRNYLARLVRLTYLAPDITTAILDGRQPIELTRQRLARVGDLPLDWQAQRELLGFSAS